MSSSALTSLQEAYVTGLLSGCQGVREMVRQGLLPFAKRYSCQLLSSEAHPYLSSLPSRLQAAPQGGYLAVDGLFVAHEGERIEGLGRHYNSSRRKAQWGQRYLSSALVYPGEDAYVLGAGSLLNEAMATDTYPYRTAGEALTALATDLQATGYQLKGVVIDTEFTSRKTLAELQTKGLALIGRYRRSNKVSYRGQPSKAKDLAEKFPPGTSRYYPKLGVYAKRLGVELEDVGSVDLVIIWKAQGYGWYLSTFISTVKLGVQELIRTYKLRWGLEVAHRLLKQNLALGFCQCFAYSAQLQHTDLAIEALHALRRQRRNYPSLSWREAQELTATERKNALLTELNLIAA